MMAMIGGIVNKKKHLLRQKLSPFLSLTILPFFSISLFGAASGVLNKDVDSIAKKAYSKIPSKSSVLFIDFQDLDGRVTYFGKYLTDQVQIALANMPNVTTIDRESFKALLEERKLAETGLIDEKSAIQIGKAIGAKSVIYGTVTELKSNVGVNLKIVDIEKGVLSGGVSHDIKKTPEISSLIGVITEQEKQKQAALDAELNAKRREKERLDEETKRKEEQLKKLDSELQDKSKKINGTSQPRNSKQSSEPTYMVQQKTQNKFSYVASRISDKFHRLSCQYARKINPENIVAFRSRNEATGAGFVPCKVCKP